MRKKIRNIAALLIAAVVLTGCGGNRAETEPAGTLPAAQTETSGPTMQEQTGPTQALETIAAPAEDLAIETPYCTLYYPGDWVPFLTVEKTEGEIYSVKFTATLEGEKLQELFTIRFGSRDDAVGAIRTPEGEQVPISLDIADIQPDDSWSDTDINIAFNMQEALNDVMAVLPLEELSQAPAAQSGTPSQEETVPAETLPPEMAEDMAIDTPHGELHYPSKWADDLTTRIDEMNGYTVAFYCSMEGHEDVYLFAVHFGGGQGSYVKTVWDGNGNSVDIRLSVTELSLDDTWTQEESDVAYAMQEDLNYLLEKLG